eukprot:EG_transcript_42026
MRRPSVVLLFKVHCIVVHPGLLDPPKTPDGLPGPVARLAPDMAQFHHPGWEAFFSHQAGLLQNLVPTPSCWGQISPTYLILNPGPALLTLPMSHVPNKTHPLTIAIPCLSVSLHKFL